MPTRLLVGMITQNSPGTMPDGVNDRLNQLRQGIQQAFQLVPPPPVVMGAGGIPVPPPPPGSVGLPTLRIFLAPEYFFRKNRNRCRNDGESTAYSTDEKNQICNELQQFSRMYPNFLLIGGSILWKDAASGNALIRHSLFVYHSGNLVKHYQKKNDCHELDDFETVPTLPYAFVPGVANGDFACEGLSWGLETCIDHDVRQLRRDRPLPVDLQLVVSNTVTLKRTSICAKPTGYVLHCNAGPGGWAVRRDPFTAALNPTAQAPAQRLALYDLPWPAPAAVAPVGGGGLHVV